MAYGNYVSSFAAGVTIAGDISETNDLYLEEYYVIVTRQCMGQELASCAGPSLEISMNMKMQHDLFHVLKARQQSCRTWLRKR